ncbi:hypothetical protein BS47DRAFT_900711 [Hydnum rufescens UP504]|uniref:RING-type domain-containing protein n=1 Tax=Hydnum rufescens UP504 TaxID=1448309 RepID=A0A9P6AYF6_9AGAM|nr:hypothetical protein BS47DRAFT_900711 [Hydnum rufescens UP504]
MRSICQTSASLLVPWVPPSRWVDPSSSHSKRTPAKDIDRPSTPEGPQASTSTSSASTSTSSSTSASSNQGYEYRTMTDHRNTGSLPPSTPSPPPYSATDPTKASRSNGAQYADWTAQTTAELTSDGHNAASREGGAKSAEPETPPGLPRETTVEVPECGICMEDMQGRAVVGAPCGHMLCRECRVLIVKAATAKGRLARCHFCRTTYAPD